LSEELKFASESYFLRLVELRILAPYDRSVALRDEHDRLIKDAGALEDSDERIKRFEEIYGKKNYV